MEKGNQKEGEGERNFYFEVIKTSFSSLKIILYNDSFHG